MPASLTMHTTNSQDSLTSNMASATIRPVKHVRFAAQLPVEGRPTSISSDSMSDSYKDWSPQASTSPVMSHGTHNNCEDRHSSTRHTIPYGSSRRESVEGFDDIKRRWSMESMSEESFAVDDE